MAGLIPTGRDKKGGEKNMLNAKVFAKAAAVVVAVFYVVCYAVTIIAPDFVFGIGASWIHSVNIDALKASAIMPFSTALWGLITISAITWVTVYATITLYNKWAKQ